MYDITVKAKGKEVKCKCNVLKPIINELRCHYEIVTIAKFEPVCIDNKCVYRVTLIAK